MKHEIRAPTERLHHSGFALQEVTGPNVRTISTHIVDLPGCCPVSGNPGPGSTVEFRYEPNGWCLEVYKIPKVLDQFVGGYKGSDHYPPDRNQEGMIRVLARMACDALGVPVQVTARINLEAGKLEIECHAEP